MGKRWELSTETEHGRVYLRATRTVVDVNAPCERPLTGRVWAFVPVWVLLAALTVHEALERTVGSRWAHAVPGTAALRIGLPPPEPGPKGPGFEPIAGMTPRRPSPSLLTSARTLSGDWRSGVSWRSAACAPGFRWPFCADDDRADKELAPTIVKPQFYPYAIYVPYACDWVTDPTDYRADAIAQADAVTPWNVSRELWLGDTEPQNPSLVNTATDVSVGGAMTPTEGLGVLLQAYFDCPVANVATGAGTGQPLVHAPLPVITAWLAAKVIAQQGDFYVGPGGSIVSPGPGYPTGADAAPDTAGDGVGDVWAYVTGPVEYALADVNVLDGAEFEPRRNRYEAIAERWAIHRFDPCCVFAVAVDVPSFPFEVVS